MDDTVPQVAEKGRDEIAQDKRVSSVRGSRQMSRRGSASIAEGVHAGRRDTVNERQNEPVLAGQASEPH